MTRLGFVLLGALAIVLGGGAAFAGPRDDCPRARFGLAVVIEVPEGGCGLSSGTPEAKGGAPTLVGYGHEGGRATGKPAAEEPARQRVIVHGRAILDDDSPRLRIRLQRLHRWHGADGWRDHYRRPDRRDRKVRVSTGFEPGGQAGEFGVSARRRGRH